MASMIVCLLPAGVLSSTMPEAPAYTTMATRSCLPSVSTSSFMEPVPVPLFSTPPWRLMLACVIAAFVSLLIPHGLHLQPQA